MFNIIIAILVVGAAGIIGYLLRLNTKPEPIVSNIARATFAVTINYVTSFIKEYQGVNYVFLNISIENKMSDDMDDVDIQTIPQLPIVSDLKYRASAENWAVDRLDAVFADTITSRVMNIEAGSIVSGYLIVAAPGTDCNIDEVTVSSKGLTQHIAVRKDRVIMKARNLRKF